MRINHNFDNLVPNYLFADVARKTNEFAAAHPETEIIKLGTGTGYSVLDVIHAFESANGLRIPYEIAPRRSGDIAVCYADPTKAHEKLHWRAEKTLEDMCRDTYHFQTMNPKGYNG